MSMTPWHGGVLAAAAVVASPALWLSVVEGTLPLGDALTRYLLSVVMCWAALNVVAQLVLPDGRREPELSEESGEPATVPITSPMDRAGDPSDVSPFDRD